MIIKNESILIVLYKKFLKRGQIVFESEKDFELFYDFVFSIGLKFHSYMLYEKYVLSTTRFCPNYLNNDYSPLTCFSFN